MLVHIRPLDDWMTAAAVSTVQSELDAARRGHKEALEATSAAEKKALLLEVS